MFLDREGQEDNGDKKDICFNHVESGFKKLLKGKSGQRR